MNFHSSKKPLQHGNGLCKELKIFLESNQKLFESSLIPDLSFINHRAENHTGIDINEVTYLEGNEYQLDYSYQWSVYNGCANMDLDGEKETEITFTIDENGDIEFEFLDIEVRDTFEEF